MARIFNIYFSYNGLIQNAIVSVRTTPFFKEFTLNNIDESLLPYLPGNKIVSRSPGDFVFMNAGEKDPTPLMNAIIKAVSEHLHATEA